MKFLVSCKESRLLGRGPTIFYIMVCKILSNVFVAVLNFRLFFFVPKNRSNKSVNNTLTSIKFCEGYELLTDAMKKSWCSSDTRPKFVYLNTLSMIHIRLGSTVGLALKVVINIGTSPVLWWLAITKVLSFIILLMSSPCSTTAKDNNNDKSLLSYKKS